MSLTKVSYSMISGAPINALDFNVDATGATDSTIAMSSAYAQAVSTGGYLVIPAGTFKGNFVFDGGISVVGAGRGKTILKANTSGSPVVTIGGDTGVGTHLNNALYEVSIDCNSTASIGLRVGDDTLGLGFSNGTISHVDIYDSTSSGLNIYTSTNTIFDQVYVYSCDIGFRITAERNVQLNTYRNCRFRLCRQGAYLQSANRETYFGCNWESNTEVGLEIQRGITSGPSGSVFTCCWWENNGPTGSPSTAYASIILDINATVATTVPHNILFQDCIVTSNSGAYDIRAIRANLVEFNRCSFSDVASGGFTSSKFSWSSNNPRVRLVNCGSLNQIPTPTVYTSFPALNADTNGQLTMGFEYWFEFEGIEYTNRKWNTFVPTIIGTSTAGTGTYTSQIGRYRKQGNIVYFNIRLEWSAHTGTGNMNIAGLPIASSASATLSTCSVYSDGLAVTANNFLMTQIGTSATTITLKQTPVGGYVAAAVPIDTTGSLIVSGFYEV